MFGPDAGHRPTLRLGAKPTKEEYVETTEIVDALASDPDVLELLRMLCTAAIDRRAAIAQSRPISAQRQPTEQTNRQHLARYDQSDPLWRLHMGDHDTRVHQHAPRYDQARVMGGHHAKVARVDGSLDAPL